MSENKKGYIYQIKNIINGKVYIGSTSKSLFERKKGHKYNLKHSKSSKHLQNAWNKYGEQNFIFETIEECEKENLIEREQYWIDYYKSYDSEFGYNIRKVAENNFGIKWDDEMKEKFSRLRKGIPHLNMRGKNHPYFGKKRPEHSELMSGEGNPMFGVEPWCKGKKRPEHSELMKKMSISSRPEVREKLSIALSGEKNPSSKLTWELVEEIRNKYIRNIYGYKKLAVEYSVDPMTIKNIVTFKSWRKKDE